MTKRIAILLILASTACSSMSKGGARGPQIQRTDDSAASQPSDKGSLDGRPELGQR